MLSLALLFSWVTKNQKVFFFLSSCSAFSHRRSHLHKKPKSRSKASHAKSVILLFLLASILMPCATFQVFFSWISVFCGLEIQKLTLADFHFTSNFLKEKKRDCLPQSGRHWTRPKTSAKQRGSLSLIKHLSQRESHGHVLQTPPICPANVDHQWMWIIWKQAVPSENVSTSGGHVMSDLQNFFRVK